MTVKLGTAVIVGRLHRAPGQPGETFAVGNQDRAIAASEAENNARASALRH